MFELAITRGGDFVAYTRHAKAILLPDGTTVLGPLSVLPHVAGDYVIRAVVLDGAEPGPLEIGGTAPPVIDGDVVIVRRTVTPMGAEQIAAAEAQALETAWAALRAERDTRLLGATAILDRHRNQRDFGLPTTLTDAQATAWATYAQALRDMPEVTTDPAAPVWPVEPASLCPTTA